MHSQICFRALFLVAGVYEGASAASAASGAPPPVPGATASGQAESCTTKPCENGFGASALSVSTAAPLAQFGVSGNYKLNTVNGPSAVVTFPNTPGEIFAPGVQSSIVTMNSTNPALSVSGGWDGGVEGASGTLDYYFEVINKATPGSVGSVGIGVTAAGHVSGSASDPTGTTTFAVNEFRSQAEMRITQGGASVLDELALAYAQFEYLNGNPIVVQSSTPNVNVNFGITSTYSGGFSINDLPLTIDTATVYRVELSASITGAKLYSGLASVDPFLIAPSGYSLEFSPGVLNGVPSGVPEPSTWTMLVFGFTGVGFIAFLSHRKSVSVAA